MAYAYVIKTDVHLAIIREAVECVRDFEGDRCVDLAKDLSETVTSDSFDDLVNEIGETRARVKYATNFANGLRELKVNEVVYFSTTGVEILQRGLEAILDRLHEAVTEPLLPGEFEALCDVIPNAYPKRYAIWADRVDMIRKNVENALERMLVGDELSREFGKLFPTRIPQ